MEKIEGVLANPFVRILIGLGLLFALLGPIFSALQTVAFQLGIFESLFFERWWNLPRITWLLALGLAAGWVAAGLSLKFDPIAVLLTAGAFLFWSLIITNLLGDLPELVRTMLIVIRSLLTIGGVLVGGLALFKAMESGQPLTGASISAMGDAVRPPQAATPQGAAPGPTTAPAAKAAASSAAGWFPDPKQEANLRYWDGTQWTEHTN